MADRTTDIDLPAAGAGVTAASAAPTTAAATTPPALRPATAEDVIRAIAKQHGVNPLLAIAVAQKESNLNPDAVGDGGLALGTFQLHGPAAIDTGVDRTDPLGNITGGVKYLRQLSDRYHGDVTKALMAYNDGMDNVDKGIVTPKAQAYASAVLANVSALSRTGHGAGKPTGQMPAVGQPSAPTTASSTASSPSFLRRAASFLTPTIPTTAAGTVQWGPTSEGREMLAGAGGGILATQLAGAVLAPETGGLSALAANVLAPIIGAGLGGGVEHATEAAIGAAPPTDTLPGLGTPVSPLVGGAARQAAFEAGGQALTGVGRAVGRRVLASRVAREAAEYLKNTGASIREQGADTVAAIRDQFATTLSALRVSAHNALTTAREQGTAAITAAQDAGSALVTKAKDVAGQHLADIELRNASEITTAKKLLDDLRSHVPSIAATGRAVADAMTGPVKRALDIAGQRVAATAAQAGADGVMVSTAPIKDALREMANKARPAVLLNAEAPRAGGATGFDRLLSTIQAADRAKATGNTTVLTSLQQKIAQQLGIDPTKMNPQLPGLIGKIFGLPDEIAFPDAHAIKMLLDESVNWDRIAKKHMEKITKGVRISLRDAMSGLAPAYDAATEQYANLVPLYRKGIGQRVFKLLAQPDGADKLAGLLTEKAATSAATLRSLLVDHAAAGGNADLGQRAWAAVRDSYTFKHLIGPGIDKLASNLDNLLTLHPEFVRTVYGDQEGAATIQRLSTIVDAVKTAEARGAEQIAQTTAIGHAGVQEATGVAKAATRAVKAGVRTALSDVKHENLVAREAVTQQQRQALDVARRQIRTAVDQHRHLRTRFKESSMAKFTQRAPEDLPATAVQALMAKGYWGARAAIRLLRGPRAADFLEWASRSEPATQQLVHILTHPVGPAVLSNFLRTAAGAFTSDTTSGAPATATPGSRKEPPVGAAH